LSAAPATPSAAASRRGPPWLALACIALALAHCVLFLGFRSLPLLDLPNHAARARIMADLLFDGGARFGALYTLEPALVPYFGADLPLVLLMHWLPPWTAATAYACLVFVALPVAVWVFARRAGLAAPAAWIAALLAQLVSADGTFIDGFAAFHLGLAALFMALAAALPFVERGGALRLGVFAGWVLVGYTMHLATPVVLAGALGGLLALRAPWSKLALGRGALLLLVPVAVVVAYSLLQPAPQTAAAIAAAARPYVWSGPHAKLQALFGYFHDFDPGTDGLRRLGFAAALGATLLAQVIGGGARAGRALLRAALPFVGSAGGCLLLYALLPASQGELFGIDLRALPVAIVFVTLAALAGFDGESLRRGWAGRLALLLALLLPAANVAYLAHSLRPADEAQNDVRTMLLALPRGARVLTIVTRIDDHMLLHAGAFALLDRDAHYPYLFSGDQGHPQAYFRYRNRPYAPSQFWVERQLPVDWPGVRREWPYLLVIGPATGLALPLATRLLAATPGAMLLQVRQDEERERVRTPL
jgi:hypothetical protein